MENKKLNEIFKELNLKEMFFILYSYEKVVLGLSDQNLFNDLKIDDNNLIEARFFNTDREIYLWTSNDLINYRIIEIDKITFPENFSFDGFIDEEYYLWNEEKERGISLNYYNLEKKEKYKIRNYYKYTEDGLIEFFDARILKFK
ncbi:MAG: CRISPR-associated protein Csx19 [candidate division WOR-3 bacterium]